MKKLLALAFALAITVTTLATGPIALAAAPSNDDFANATMVPTTGLVDMITTSEATLEPSEPSYCDPISNSVWYKFSAGTSSYNVVFDTAGSDYPAYQTLYLATAEGLQPVGCYGPSPIYLYASPGETWYVQVTGTPEGGTGGTTTTGGTSTGTTTTTTGATSTSTGTSTTDGSTTGGTTGTSTGTTGTSTGTTTGTTGTTGTSTGTTGTSTGGSIATASTTATTASGNLVFTATVVQIVPIDVAVTVGRSGSVNRDGTTAIVSGTITCSRAASASVDVVLTQIFAGRMVATGTGTAYLDCGPTPRAWSVEVAAGGPIRFGAGNATADIVASAGDDHGSGYTQASENVHLKRAK